MVVTFAEEPSKVCVFRSIPRAIIRNCFGLVYKPFLNIYQLNLTLRWHNSCDDTDLKKKKKKKTTQNCVITKDRWMFWLVLVTLYLDLVLSSHQFGDLYARKMSWNLSKSISVQLIRSINFDFFHPLEDWRHWVWSEIHVNAFKIKSHIRKEMKL